MKFSVIIPAYNAEKYIKRTLSSVIEQTYKNWEIIVVNDGSTDSTREIVLNYISKYKEFSINLIDIPNGGLANARNIGIKSATGDYICNLDADDFLNNDIFYKISRLNTSFDICFYGFNDIEEETGNLLFKYEDHFSYLNDKVNGVTAALKKIKKEIWICQGNAVYSLKMIHKYNIWNIKGLNQGEDFYFIMRALIHAEYVCSIPYTAFNCLNRKNSMMHSKFNESYIQILQAIKFLISDVKSYTFINDNIKNELLIYLKKEYFIEQINIAKRICNSQSLFKVNKAINIIDKYKFDIRTDYQLIYSYLSKKEYIQYWFFKKSIFIFFYLCKLYNIIY